MCPVCLATLAMIVAGLLSKFPLEDVTARLPGDEARRGHERGWTAIVAKLAEHIGKGREDGK